MKGNLAGMPLKHGVHQTDSAIVDFSSTVIEAGEPVAFARMSLSGEEIICTSFKGVTSPSIIGIALRKFEIPLGEDETYKGGEIIPIRRFGEVLLKVEGTVAFKDKIKIAGDKITAGAGPGIIIGEALSNKDENNLVRVNILLNDAVPAQSTQSTQKTQNTQQGGN